MLDSEQKRELIEQTRTARLLRKNLTLANNSTVKQRNQNERDYPHEEGYKTIIENIPCAVYSAFPGKTGPTTFMSNKWQEWTGYSPEELYHDPEAWPKCIHTDDREEALSAYVDACTKQVPYNIEYRVIHKETGHIRYVSDQGHLSKDEQGAVVRVDGIISDISQQKELKKFRDHLEETVRERTAELLKANEILKLEDINLKKAVEELSESEEKFRTMFELSPYSTVLADLKGNILACNEQFTKMHATKEGPHAQIGRNVSEFFSEEERPVLSASIGKTIALNNNDSPTEYKMLREDGTMFLAEARRTLILDGHGKPRALLAIAQDITERKKAEKALRYSERRYETVVENAGEGIVVVQDAKIQFVNPYVEGMFGHPKEKFLNRPFIEFIHPEDREQVMGIYKRRLQGEEIPPFYEIRVIDKHNDTRWVENNGILIEWNGKPATLNFVRDVTLRREVENALRKSEERYRRFYEDAPLGYQSLDSHGNFLDVNKEWLNILGYSKKEVIGRCFADFVAPEYIENFVNNFSRLMDCGRTRGTEFEMLAKDGRRILVSFNGNIEYDCNGRFQRTHSIMQEITEQRKAELALHESEEKYRQLFEMETDAIVMFDAETKRYIDVNDAAVNLYGYTREEFLSLTPYDITADRDATEISIRQTAEGFSTRIPLRRHKKKDGTIFPVEVSGSSFMLNGRRVMFGVIRDISDRRKVEELLEKQRFYLAKAQEMGRIGTWEMNILRNKAVWTKENYRIFAIEIGTELTYEIILNCVHPEDREYVDRKWKAALDKEPCDFEHRILVEGEVRWVREKADVQFNENGIAISAIGFTQDITERKQAEQKILENRKQLKSLAAQLSRIEDRERHRLATTLHDQIGQSLVFSKLRLDELRTRSPYGEFSDILEEVSLSIEKVIQETRALTFDLSSPILYELGFEAAVTEWLADEIEKKHGIETEFCDDGQEKPLDNDIRALLFRNVRELLVNVIRHAQAHKVKVDISKIGADICVCVKDDGIGFDPDEVMAKAVRSDKFGLFSIRERLEQLGGLIEIGSELGRGSRVLMRVPLKYETLTDGMEL